jgi:hypothetical protein
MSELHMERRLKPREIHFFRYKISGAPTKFEKCPVPYLGLELTILVHFINSQIDLVIQSL